MPIANLSFHEIVIVLRLLGHDSVVNLPIFLIFFGNRVRKKFCTSIPLCGIEVNNELNDLKKVTNVYSVSLIILLTIMIIAS